METTTKVFNNVKLVVTNKVLVTFYYAGCFCSDSSLKEYDSLDNVKFPKGAYSYVAEELTINEAVFPNGFKVSDRKTKSIPGTTYKSGKIYNEKQIKEEVKDNDILLRNMENNHWEKVIKTAQGFLPFEKQDKVLNYET